MSGMTINGPTATITLDQLNQLAAQGKTPQYDNAVDQQAYLDAVNQAKQQAAGGVSNPTLVIPTPTNAADLASTLNNLGNAIGNAPLSLDDILVMLHQLASELKKSAREARAAEQQLQVNAINAQAADIRESANFALAAGIVQGVTQIGAGVMSGIGAIKSTKISLGEGDGSFVEPEAGDLQGVLSKLSGKEDVSSANQVKGLDDMAQSVTTRPRSKVVTERPAFLDAPDQGAPTTRPRSDAITERPKFLDDPDDGASGTEKPKKSAAMQQHLDAMAQATQMKWSALSQITTGIGGIGQAILEFESKMSDAKQKEDEALATKIGYQAQSWDDMVKSMTDLMSDVRQKLGDMVQAQNEVATKIWS